MADQRLTLPDMLFANALAFLAVRLVSDPAREDLMIAQLRDTLPRLSAHPQMQRMALAARCYLAVLDEDPGSLRVRGLASTHIAGACADFLFWRAACAREALAQADAIPQAPGGSDDARHAAQ